MLRRFIALALTGLAVCAGSARADDDIETDDEVLAAEPVGLRGITAAHNQVRARVGARPLTWSAALAATAQGWAQACVDQESPRGLIDHNPRRSDGHPYYVGENIYGASGGGTGALAVAAWASQAPQYDYATNTCAGMCGHYTQVVWGETRELGCAIARCPALASGESIVCNYGPGGNYDRRPY